MQIANLLRVAWMIGWILASPLSTVAWDDLIDKHCVSHGIRKEIVEAIIEVESAGHPFAVGVAIAAGASRVFASDLNDRRLAIAQKMGAHVTLNPQQDDVVARIMELTDGIGVDVVCEMSGHPVGHAQAFATARHGGRVNFLGTPSTTTEVDFAGDVIFKGLTLYGVTGRKMYQTWHQMQRFLRAGQLDPTPVLTHRFPLSDIAQAIEVIKDGAAGKVILEIAS